LRIYLPVVAGAIFVKTHPGLPAEPSLLDHLAEQVVKRCQMFYTLLEVFRYVFGDVQTDFVD